MADKLRVKDLKLAHIKDMTAEVIGKMDGPMRELVALFSQMRDCEVIHQVHEHQRDILETIDEAVEYLI